MQYHIIDNLIYAYLKNEWTGLDIPETIEISYYQEGSGDPSPDNIRAIFPGAVFNINNVDTPVYNGELDVINKQLILKSNYIKLNDASNFVRFTTGDGMTVFRKNVLSSGITTEREQISNIFRFSANANVPTVSNDNTFVVGSSGNLFLQTMNIRSVEELNTFLSNNELLIIYPLNTSISYNIDSSEIGKYLNGNISNDIAHRLKLPLPHYFPHAVIDALISASDGQQTEEENEILKHYLTPLGIGGI